LKQVWVHRTSIQVAVRFWVIRNKWYTAGHCQWLRAAESRLEAHGATAKIKKYLDACQALLDSNAPVQQY
jgi:hypothetical protein